MLYLRNDTTLNTGTGISWNDLFLDGLILTLSSVLTVTGTVFFDGTTHSFVGANRFTQCGNFNISNPTAAATVTLPNNVTVTGDLISSTSSGAAHVLNGFQISVGGNLTINELLQGTTTVLLNGTGTWSGSAAIQKNVTINTTGTITFATTVIYNTGTLTYTAGTVVTTGSTFTISVATTLNTAGLSFNNVSFTTGVLTLSSTLTVGGTLTLGAGTISFVGGSNLTGINNIEITGSATVTLPNNVSITGSLLTTNTTATQTLNGFQLSVGGGITTTGTSGTLIGTTAIVLNGTGTWTGTSTIRNNLTINTTGTIAISGTAEYDTGTLTYTAGTVVTTGSTLIIAAATTLNTSGISWNIVSIETSAGITLNSLLVADSIILTRINPDFIGTAGFTCGTLSITYDNTNPSAFTLKSGNTYTVTANINSVYGTYIQHTTINASTPGSRANLIIDPGATQNLSYVDATDIDSSGGIPVWSFGGNFSNAINWSALTAESGAGGAGAGEKCYVWAA
jgi:hypothetical protein